MLRRARAEPETLAIGIDAAAAAMRESSRRAASAPGRGGVANALFLVESAERLPGPLAGRADLVTVALPWGSLLRALVEPDPGYVRGVVALLKPRAELVVLATDQLRALDICAAAGLVFVESRAAGIADIELLSSAWARRLGVPRRRPALLYRFRVRRK